MDHLKVGDIVARKSYGEDVYFKISDIQEQEDGKKIYVLRGMLYRIHADCEEEDLIKQDLLKVRADMHRYITRSRRHAMRHRTAVRMPMFMKLRARSGKILHIDSSREYLEMCMDHYREASLRPIGFVASESEQPHVVRRLLMQNRPDILVLTGHDSMKKDADRNSLDSYQHSRYFVEAVEEARRYEASLDRLCIFAGACQSYYERIMETGANFASSPGRILINALDPAFVSEKVALTDSRAVVTPQEVARLTISGSDGIGGINTRGHLLV